MIITGTNLLGDVFMEQNMEVTKMSIPKENIKLNSIRLTLYQMIKDVFDILFSFIGIVLMLPIALIIKIAYMLSGDFHSIFFVQKRIGRNGKEFDLYKFRTMVPNADEILFEMLKKDKKLAKEYKINKKLEHDPRITKIGRIVRRFSIDELPQFLNVYLGDMTLIGNRPYLPREKEDMGKYYNDIIKTRPGLTGYWQVSGRSNTTFEQRLKLEQYYSNNCSLWMDIKIFFKTFKVVIFGKDAK